jgi:hypothetical protein
LAGVLSANQRDATVTTLAVAFRICSILVGGENSSQRPGSFFFSSIFPITFQSAFFATHTLHHFIAEYTGALLTHQNESHEKSNHIRRHHPPLASCHGRFSPAETKPVKYTNPDTYYSARTNDFSRIFHALKINPSDIYSSYNTL